MHDFWHETGTVFIGEAFENDVENTQSQWGNNIRCGEQVKQSLYLNLFFDTYLCLK